MSESKNIYVIMVEMSYPMNHSDVCTLVAFESYDEALDYMSEKADEYNVDLHEGGESFRILNDGLDVGIISEEYYIEYVELRNG